MRHINYSPSCSINISALHTKCSEQFNYRCDSSTHADTDAKNRAHFDHCRRSLSLKRIAILFSGALFYLSLWLHLLAYSPKRMCRDNGNESDRNSATLSIWNMSTIISEIHDLVCKLQVLCICIMHSLVDRATVKYVNCRARDAPCTSEMWYHIGVRSTLLAYFVSLHVLQSCLQRNLVFCSSLLIYIYTLLK